MSPGSSPVSHPAKPLVSYQINRQLSGCNLPPLVIRAFGAHSEATQSNFLPALPDCVVASSRLRGYVEPAFAGRFAFDVDAALGSLL
ncbi:MAG: hypothetical protein ACRECP_09550, partial [Methylocella sp.]